MHWHSVVPVHKLSTVRLCSNRNFLILDRAKTYAPWTESQPLDDKKINALMRSVYICKVFNKKFTLELLKFKNPIFWGIMLWKFNIRRKGKPSSTYSKYRTMSYINIRESFLKIWLAHKNFSAKIFVSWIYNAGKMQSMSMKLRPMSMADLGVYAWIQSNVTWVRGHS